LRDGILRVGKTAAVKLSKEPLDEWFSMLGDNPTTNLLKLYAQVSTITPINIVKPLYYAI
jgi:mediator of RNA polymerase II transcription subunit 13